MDLLRFSTCALVLLSGCGLVLDAQPPDDPNPVRFDAGARDAAGFDAGSDPDAGGIPCSEDVDCDDADACNGVETCGEGRCRQGSPLSCGDAFPCTRETCDPTQGCSREADDTLCPDDGFACTVERCDLEVGCEIDFVDAACDDGIFCTIDVCDPRAPGGCRHDAADERCGRASCDPETGCVGIECASDVDCLRRPCDLEARCEGGVCARTLRADGARCEDDNPCTDETACLLGECRGTVTTRCPGQPCVLCNAAGGGCDGSMLAAPSTPCSDGSLCTSGDHCDAFGVCSGMPGTACPSLGACRTSACDPATGGCVSADVSGPCNDLNPCTTGDTCERGACVGTPMSCNDGNPCTTDACSPTGGTGLCMHSPAPAGTECPPPDTCTVRAECNLEGRCEPTTPFCAPSTDPCTMSGCTPSSPPLCFTAFVDGPCAMNASCTLGSCRCNSGFADCDGDGNCECSTATSFCNSTTRSCAPFRACAGCAVGQECCRCTGACFDPVCLSCCMFCPSAG